MKKARTKFKRSQTYWEPAMDRPIKSVWKFTENEEGRFNILRNEVLLSGNVPERWLEEELAKYGFCGVEFKAIREKLQQDGIAVVELQG